MNSLFIYFLLTVFVINITPGPAMMFALQQSQKNGIQAGLVATLGVETGVLIYVILTAFGISAIFNRYPAVYTGLQLMGAIYLLYLAYQSWPRKNSSVTIQATPSYNHKSTYLKGVLVNLTNPKIALFFLSLIPQFVPQGSHTLTFMLYGLLLNVGGLVVNGSVALLANKINRLVNNASWFDYVPPILFLVIAVLAIYSRF